MSRKHRATECSATCRCPQERNDYSYMSEIKLGKHTLINGDCLELMKDIPTGSVDMVLCDLPYGVTCCEWDVVIPFEPLWEQYHRVCKKNAAIVLFSQLPFMIDLINSNRKEFRYEWIWRKDKGSNFLNAHKMPMKVHENILVFYKSLPVYNPQKSKVDEKNIRRDRVYNGSRVRQYDVQRQSVWKESGYRFPCDIIKFGYGREYYAYQNDLSQKHPTQKPVALCEYLIKTYTNEGETVLDNTMGSGTTGVACVNTGRKFIGMELEQKYFDIATRRIAEAQKALSEMLL